MDYVRSAATAKRLIEKNGRTVEIIKVETDPADASKPWRGPADPSRTVVASPKALIVDVEEKDVDGSLVRLGMRKAYIAHTSVNMDLSDTDFVRDSSRDYKVCKVGVIKPADTPILYELFLES